MANCLKAEQITFLTKTGLNKKLLFVVDTIKVKAEECVWAKVAKAEKLWRNMSGKYLPCSLVFSIHPPFSLGALASVVWRKSKSRKSNSSIWNVVLDHAKPWECKRERRGIRQSLSVSFSYSHTCAYIYTPIFKRSWKSELDAQDHV